jgi:hypothetical protein
MGTNVSKQTGEKLTELVNNTINNYTTNIEKSSSSSSYSNQTFKLKFRNVNCSGFSVNQVSSVKLDIINKNTTALSTVITSEVKNSIENLTKIAIDQQNKDLSIGQTNVANIEEKTTTYINNDLENNINNILKETFTSSSSGNQLQDIDITGSNLGKCNFDQRGIIENISRNLSDVIMNGVTASFTDSEIDSITENELAQKNTGINVMIFFYILGAVAGLFILIGGIFLIKSLYAPSDSAFVTVATKAIDKAPVT